MSEQERLGKALKDEERELQVKQLEHVRQAQLWRDVVKYDEPFVILPMHAKIHNSFLCNHNHSQF